MSVIKANLDKKQQQNAKKYLLKNHTYKIMAYMLAFAGFVVFAILYNKFIDGDIMNFIYRPVLAAIIVVPFLPALILMILSKRAREKAAKLIERANEAQEASVKNQP